MITQLNVKRILFATDFLQGSRLALDYAVSIAHHFKASIAMLHVVEITVSGLEAELDTGRPCLTRQEAQERLEALAAGVRRAGIEVETYIEEGVPAEQIVGDVTSHAADILVLGVRGIHRGVAHVFIGSNAEKVLLSATRPTVTVGPQVLTGVDLEIHPKEIVYYSDFTPEATSAAPYAILLGREFRVPVAICQLFPEVALGNQKVRQELADRYCEMMRHVLADPSSDWYIPEFQLEHGMEIDQLINRAESQHAGLIVLGVRTPSKLKGLFTTSFAIS